MSVLINASTSTGVGITSDNSGVLQFQSNGANTADIQANGTLTASNVTTTGRVTAGNITLSASGLITFPDATTQSTAATGGMTLLGTLTTTSGASQSLTGLNLTTYKQVVLVFQGVSGTISSVGLLLGTSTADDILITTGALTLGMTLRGFAWIDLTNGTYSGILADATASQTSDTSTTSGARGGDVTITTASTSISVAYESGNFDAGSILVYGVK